MLSSAVNSGNVRFLFVAIFNACLTDCFKYPGILCIFWIMAIVVMIFLYRNMWSVGYRTPYSHETIHSNSWYRWYDGKETSPLILSTILLIVLLWYRFYDPLGAIFILWFTGKVACISAGPFVWVHTTVYTCFGIIKQDNVSRSTASYYFISKGLITKWIWLKQRI